MSDETKEPESAAVKNFIEQKVEADLQAGKNGGRVQTRFPPEPNGYLHIGHAKAIALDFGIARAHGGICNLRLDDTNPVKEGDEYVEAIKEDIRWLGFQWGAVLHASDYFGQLWDFAVALIKQGRAYVDEQTSEQIAAQKGTPTEPGQNSPYRDRPAEESLRLFELMNSGQVQPGKMVLRAKIDMAAGNLHFRDPIIYRVLNVPHARTGNRWNAYPMYDFAHGESDFFEGVTHSLCTLEFVVHRPLYDLFVDWLKETRRETDDLDDNRPRQTEFNKLNLSYTLMSKRNLLALVQNGLVSGWDDPRMPTLCGLRRRGYSPEAILSFIERIGYTTYDALNEMALLESAVRDDLNSRATRVSAVLDPIELRIDNYTEGLTERLVAVDNPEEPESATHEVLFGGRLWIEREDFLEEAPKKYFRLRPGGEVRLKNAYIVKCTGCEKGPDGRVTVVHCEMDPSSRSGMPGADRKVKGTIHWVCQSDAVPAEVRLYDRLWLEANPRDAMTRLQDEQHCQPIDAMRQIINPDSLRVVPGALVEPYAATFAPLAHLQFQRIGYFNVDPDSTPNHPVFNRTVTLKAAKI